MQLEVQDLAAKMDKILSDMGIETDGISLLTDDDWQVIEQLNVAGKNTMILYKGEEKALKLYVEGLEYLPQGQKDRFYSYLALLPTVAEQERPN